DGRDHAHALERRIGDAPAAAFAVAAGDLEIALRGPLDAADARIAVFGELLGGAARILGRLGHHLRLHVVEPGERVGHARAFLEQDAAPHEVELPPYRALRAIDIGAAQGHPLTDGEDRHAILRVARDVDP